MLTRTRSFFWTKPFPGRWVIVATALVVGAAVLMSIEGWLMAPLPPSLVASLLLVAAAFVFFADLLKVALSHYWVGGRYRSITLRGGQPRT